jgi:fido (protein-threonine AMPylation protein)
MPEVPGDPARSYTPEQERTLSVRLKTLLEAIYHGKLSAVSFTVALLQNWHHMLFEGIKDHAGRLRSRNFGDDPVFGLNRGLPRAKVPQAMEAYAVGVRRRLRALADIDRGELRYFEAALHVCLWSQAEFIRIHPFMDGSGRLGRVITPHLMVQTRVPIICSKRPKKEYFDALNEYHARGELRPLVDLYMQEFSEQSRG